MLLTYDMEIYPDALIAVFKDYTTKEFFVLEKSPFNNNIGEFITWFKLGKFILISYNGRKFDDPFLYYIYNNPNKTTQEYKEFANQLINSRKPIFPSYKIYPNFIRTGIDTMVINNYGIYSAKTTSLKMLKFNFRKNAIADLPYDHTKPLNTKSKIAEVIKYCKDDVNATEDHFDVTKPLIKYRREYGKLNGYQDKLINTTEVEFAKTIITDLIKEKLNLEYDQVKKLATYRDIIHIKDILVDNIEEYKDIYNFEFEENKELYNFYKETILKTIDSTKMSLKDGMEDVPVISLKNSVNKVITYKSGLVTKYGTGGIHGCFPSGVYKSTDDIIIRDFDFGSFYPHLMYSFGIGPNHLPKNLIGKQLIEVWFKDIFEKYPKKTHYDMNHALKIIMNLTYGLLGSEFGPLLDIQAQLAVCVNGMLLITKATEISELNNCQTIYQNTDGWMVQGTKEDIDKLTKIIEEFAKRIKIPIEYQDIDVLYLNDVNNYSLRTKSGEIKEKGLFMRYENICKQSEYHKNTSANIIPIALYEYFYNNKDIEETIYNHNNIHDFAIAVKGGKSFDLLVSRDNEGTKDIIEEDIDINKLIDNNEDFILVENRSEDNNGRYTFKFIKQEMSNNIIKNEVINQRVIRYIICTKGITLTKFWHDNTKKSNSFSSVEANNPIRVINNISKADLYDTYKDGTIKSKTKPRFPNLDWEYYINKTRKIIESIEDIETV